VKAANPFVKVPKPAPTAEEMTALAEARKRSMSPPGSLGLPAYLDEVRLRYNLTDGYFEHQALWDRIFVAQIREVPRETHFEGGRIIKTENTQSAEKYSSPRGVIVSAGLQALDAMRSHGIDLGERVCFIQQAPWRMKIDTLDTGHEEWVLIFRVGDISASSDQVKRLRSGEMKVVPHEDASGCYTHKIQDKEGKVWTPLDPFIREDM
jgi:hypothetical protein